MQAQRRKDFGPTPNNALNSCSSRRSSCQLSQNRQPLVAAEAVSTCDIKFPLQALANKHRLFALGAACCQPDLNEIVPPRLPAASRPQECQDPLYLACPDRMDDITDEFDLDTNAMHDSDQEACRLDSCMSTE
jgi:hypothetical protein